MSSFLPDASGKSIHPRPLPPALRGQREDVFGPPGRLSIYKAGAGRPLLLVHSVNAAASAAEVRPLFERYSRCRRIFALELPGFGFSDRSERPYTVRLMTDAIHAATNHIREECGDIPIDALGLSLSCEFLARAALEHSQFRSLTFVSPTGFSSKSLEAHRSSATSAWPQKLLIGTSFGSWAFRILTQPCVIRYFLRRTWGSTKIDERLWRYCILTAGQPGAEHAPLYFLSGALFSSNAQSLYQQLECPVWVSHGTRGDFVDYQNIALVESESNWRHSVFTSGALPYFEHPDAFFSQYDCFLELAGIASRVNVRSVLTPPRALARH